MRVKEERARAQEWGCARGRQSRARAGACSRRPVQQPPALRPKGRGKGASSSPSCVRADWMKRMVRSKRLLRTDCPSARRRAGGRGGGSALAICVRPRPEQRTPTELWLSSVVALSAPACSVVHCSVLRWCGACCVLRCDSIRRTGWRNGRPRPTGVCAAGSARLRWLLLPVIERASLQCVLIPL